MVFSSLTFLYLFLPLCFICYYIVQKTSSRNVILLVFSLVFYAWGEPKYIFLMIATAFVDYVFGLLIERFRGRWQSKLFLTLAAVITLSSLALFKYSSFFSENVNSLFSLNLPSLKLALPIGISFYTFQALTYVIDVYRGSVKVQPSFYKLLLYVSMFPQLIAGPIVRYSDVEEQIEERTVTLKNISAGVMRFSAGLLKKAIIANFAGQLTEKLIGGDLTGLSSAGAWIGIISYTLQIYFDFSGYSDMAIGLGHMFGFSFPENFNYPYYAVSVSDFWRRWHITLSSFFRDYLYIPLGGNRKNWALNMLIVWLLTGLWHGAAWNFILWGLYYGCFMLFEQKMGKKRMKKWPIVWKHVYTKLVIILGFGIFYFEDLGQLGQFFLNITGISMIANGAPFTDPMTFSSLRNNIFLILFAILVSLPVLPKIKSYFLESKNDTVYTIGRVGSVAVCMVLLAVVSVLLVDTTNNVFLYFRF